MRGWVRSVIVFACVASACGASSTEEDARRLELRAAELVGRLSSNNELERALAAEELARRDALPAAAIPTLAPALIDPNISVRKSIATALGRIGPAALPALSQAMTHPDLLVRSTAAEGVRMIGPKAVPALLELAAAGDVMITTSAHGVLEAMGPAIVPDLIVGLGSKNGEVRGLAADVLWAFKAEARPAIPALIEALGRDREINAATTLKAIGLESVPPLIAVVGDPGRPEEMRVMAVFILSTLEPPAKEAVPVVRSALADASARVRFAAAVGVADIDPASRADARAVLVDLAKSPDAEMRLAAERALKPLGPR